MKQINVHRISHDDNNKNQPRERKRQGRKNGVSQRMLPNTLVAKNKKESNMCLPRQHRFPKRVKKWPENSAYHRIMLPNTLIDPKQVKTTEFAYHISKAVINTRKREKYLDNKKYGVRKNYRSKHA